MPYSPTKSTTHTRDGLAKLLEQFKERPDLAALLTSLLAQIQELENGAWEVIETTGIDQIYGAALDDLGVVVGRGRGDLVDSDYRIALRAQIRINRSCGTPEDLLAVGSLSVPSGFTVELWELYPAAVAIRVIGAVTWSVSALFESLRQTKAGGVRLFLIWAQDVDANLFQYSAALAADLDPYVPEYSATHGWGNSSDPAVGGKLASVIATA